MTPNTGADPSALDPPTDVSVPDRDDRGEPAAGTTVDLCVRSLSEDAQPLLDETLRRLDGADEVDRVRVVVWGRSFDPTGPAAATDPGRALADRLETFRRWAAENGASFGPFFRARTVDRFAGETRTRVDLPTVSLAEYRDGDLAFVAPCRLGGRYRAVLDRAERLSAGDPRSVIAVEAPDRVDPPGEGGAPVRT